MGDPLGQLRKFSAGQIPQARAELRPPSIEVIVDGVGGAPAQAHPHAIDRGPEPVHEQLIRRLKDIGLRNARHESTGGAGDPEACY
jgi:hypothetical protein